jgi:hypothetical protein
MLNVENQIQTGDSGFRRNDSPVVPAGLCAGLTGNRQPATGNQNNQQPATSNQ